LATGQILGGTQVSKACPFQGILSHNPTLNSPATAALGFICEGTIEEQMVTKIILRFNQTPFLGQKNNFDTMSPEQRNYNCIQQHFYLSL